MAFARRVRISMLRGVGCSEQYLPHRVAMQLGTDLRLHIELKAFAEELEQMITRIKAARLRLKLLT
jgi:hypothetical protein